MSFSYSYLTRKQVNIIYAAWKDGRIRLDDDFVSAVYDIVGRQELDQAERHVQWQAENIVKWLVEDRNDLAQAIADGYYVIEAYETHTRPATEDDWFYEVGEPVEENVFAGYEVVSPDEYWARRDW